MMLTSPKHEWRLKKPSAHEGTLWKPPRRSSSTCTALTVVSRFPKLGKPTGFQPALTARKPPNGKPGDANHVQA